MFRVSTVLNILTPGHLIMYQGSGGTGHGHRLQQQQSGISLGFRV
jgi:hypothetical protein